MKRSLSSLALGALLLAGSGCYHARIETGMTPGTKVVDHPWALSFVAGLIPPATVNAAADCPNGVAVVETQHSFLNQLVAFLTGSLITPMHITVTCAAGNMGAVEGPHETMTVAREQNTATTQAIIGAAAEKAVQSGRPVVVNFAE